MNDKALKTLEYDKILQMLERKAISPMGKEKALALLPSAEFYEVNKRQEETANAVTVLLRRGSLPLGGVKDLRVQIQRLKIGGVLSIAELMSLAETLYVCRKMKAYGVKDDKISFPVIEHYFERIVTLDPLETELNRCIQNENELCDDASAKLKEIRRAIKQANSKVQDSLNSVIHSKEYKTMLQDTLITIRNGRFCVPVKAEYRNSFAGMIHDQSATGATIFVEPMSVVSINNKIKSLLGDEEQEIHRILAKLSAEASGSCDIIENNSAILAELDFIFAKGELALLQNATPPRFNQKGRINIIKGRHPLLNTQHIVPTDISLGGEFTTLLITGPNTGGKTVALKLLGLLTLMGQAGLMIPAQEGSELSVFDSVYADIGDEQSIEQSLSTFSGHMKNIVSILGEVTDNSLVLLDELGAGTDPTEGAALGISIVQYLFDRRIRTAITTHYSELKVYALETKGIENAACEFDIGTLMPTYRLLIGVPGKSNAFAISRRLGLPEHIIDSAKEYLSHADERFEDVITDLESNKKTAAIEREKAESYRREAEKLKTEFDKQKKEQEQRREKYLEKAREEAQAVLQDAKDQASKIIKEMQRLAADSDNVREADAKRAELRGLAEKYQSTEEQTVRKPITKPLNLGDKVYIHSMKQSAEVLTLPDSSGRLTVLAGIMKIMVKLTDLSPDDSPAPAKKQNTLKASKPMGMDAVRNELDLRGQTVDEALFETDNYLDRAARAGLVTVSLIHGKGTGALRDAVTQHLKGHPHVKAYRLGKYGEGESGVTVVELE